MGLTLVHPQGGTESKTKEGDTSNSALAAAENQRRAIVLQFHRQPRKLSTCTACGDHFFVCQSWHTYCFQCFAGNRLYSALARYREARS